MAKEAGGPEHFDLVIVGSGAGSVPAALLMQERGLSAVILEKQAVFGGTSAWSGGVIWAPGNDHLQATGAGDTEALAEAYFDAVVGPPQPSSSRARRLAWIREGKQMVRLLEAKGMKFFHSGLADYYDAPGSLSSGRGLATPIFNLRELGDWQQRLSCPANGPRMPLHIMEAVKILSLKKTWAGRGVLMLMAWRKLKERLRGGRLTGGGSALIGRLLKVALDQGVPIRLETTVREFIVEDGRVAGVVADSGGKHIEFRARRGVLVNAGGFSRNKAMREEHSPSPASTRWTMVNPGDTGEMIQAMIGLGADTAQMDEAFWFPVSLLPDETPAMHSPGDLGKPHCIVVDSRGARFVNEANPYMEVGRRMYDCGAVPAWAIFDSRHRRDYFWGMVPPSFTSQALIDAGYFQIAETLPDLAQRCGVDVAGLQETVARFNGHAIHGEDAEFGRGTSAFNRYYGDPTVRPNPNLGTIEQPPFYAVKLWPGDIGTCGGIVADEHARALRPDGSPIPGLYVTGNSSASAGGRAYIGAGASVGPAMIFGYVAALHSAGE